MGKLILIFLLLVSHFQVQTGQPTLSGKLLTQPQAAVGQVQTWYLVLTTADGQQLRDLTISNALPEYWSIPEVKLDQLTGQKAVPLQVTALKPGARSPMLLVTYSGDAGPGELMVLGEDPVTVQAVGKQVLLQVLSTSQNVSPDQTAWVSLAVINESPFPVSVTYQVIGDGVTLVQPPLPQVVPAGEQQSVNLRLAMAKSEAPVIEAVVDWQDSTQVRYQSRLQAPAGLIEVDQGLFSPSPLRTALLGALFGLATAILPIFIKWIYDRLEQRRKDREQAASLLEVVLAHYRQAQANRKAVDGKLLETFFCSTNLFNVLRDRHLVKEVANLWDRGESYTHSLNSSDFAQRTDELQTAIQALSERLNGKEKK